METRKNLLAEMILVSLYFQETDLENLKKIYIKCSGGGETATNCHYLSELYSYLVDCFDSLKTKPDNLGELVKEFVGMTDYEYILSHDITDLLSRGLTTGVALRREVKGLIRDPKLIRMGPVSEKKTLSSGKIMMETIGIYIVIQLGETRVTLTSEPSFNTSIPVFTFSVPWRKEKVNYLKYLSWLPKPGKMGELVENIERTRNNLMVDFLLVSEYFKEENFRETLRDITGSDLRHLDLSEIFSELVDFHAFRDI